MPAGGVALAPCDSTNVFCCGQDEAARACCNTGNATIMVNPVIVIQSSTAMATVTETNISTFTMVSATMTVTANPNSERDCGVPIEGLAGGLGSFLVIVLIVLAFTIWKLRRQPSP